MRILHIVAGLPPGGGISESVPALCRHLRQRGHEVTLATLGGPASEAATQAEKDGVRRVQFTPSWPRRLYFSWDMVRGLAGLVKQSDVVHVHSNWTFPVWWGCHLALKTNTSLVMSPEGCLDPVRLRYSAWKKRIAGILDLYYLRHSQVLHATCDAEAEGIRKHLKSEHANMHKRGDSGQGTLAQMKAGENEFAHPLIVVIPIGLDMEKSSHEGPKAGSALTNDLPREAVRRRTVLFLGRLHPLKGLDLLVDAWKRVAADCPDWHLLVIGPDEQGTLAGLREQVNRLALGDRITFGGPVYGEEKRQMMAAADLFALPTRSENFGIVVAEALSCGVPVITTKGAPWQDLQGSWESKLGARRGISRFDESENAVKEMANVLKNAALSHAANGRCGWWVDIGVDPLVEALREAMSLTDAERSAMGVNGQRLVAAKYQWPEIARKMENLYEKLLKGGE